MRSVPGFLGMTISELKAKLLENDVLSDAFDFEIGNLPERYTLIRNEQVWLCYYFERGDRVNLEVFRDEASACDYFLAWVLSDPAMRKSWYWHRS